MSFVKNRKEGMRFQVSIGVLGCVTESGVVAEDGQAGVIPKSPLQQNYQTQQGNGNGKDSPLEGNALGVSGYLLRHKTVS